MVRHQRTGTTTLVQRAESHESFAHHRSGRASKPSWTVRPGELFDRGDSGAAADLTVESGSLLVQIVTLSGVELCLGKVAPGELLIDVGAISSPAFAVCYRAIEPARIVEQTADTGGHAIKLSAYTALLRAAVQLVHEVACLQTSHRLYCELLRMDALRRLYDADRIDLPAQAALALRLCTTRETISRELSFLRRAGVITPVGQKLRILNPGFLLAKIASALQLSSEEEVWTSIGACWP